MIDICITDTFLVSLSESFRGTDKNGRVAGVVHNNQNLRNFHICETPAELKITLPFL